MGENMPDFRNYFLKTKSNIYMYVSTLYANAWLKQHASPLRTCYSFDQLLTPNVSNS